MPKFPLPLPSHPNSTISPDPFSLSPSPRLSYSGEASATVTITSSVSSTVSFNSSASSSADSYHAAPPSPSAVDFFACKDERDFLNPHLPTKEELLLSLEKTDHEINKTEFDISNYKRAKLKLEQSPKKTEKAHVRHTAQSLMQMIYDENKERAAQCQDELIAVVPLPITEVKPVPIQELEVYKANLEFHQKHRGQILEVMKQRTKDVWAKQKELTAQYKKMHEAWSRKIRLMEESKPIVGKSKKKGPPRGRPALRANAPGTPRGNNRRSLLSSSDAVRSEEEFEQVLSQLRELDNADPDSRFIHSVAEIPPMILDPKVRALRYIDTNGFVEDSMAMERERKATMVWTEEEKDIFVKKYLLFPKRFKKIASFIESKTTEDVVAFYYSTKKTLNLKKMLRQHQLKKRGRKPSAAAAAAAAAAAQEAASNVPREVANLSSVMTSNYWDTISERPRNRQQMRQAQQESIYKELDLSDDETTRPALLRVTSSSQVSTTSVSTSKDGTVTNQYESRWTAREKELFIEAFTKNGKVWKVLSDHIGTKSHTQCKTYYNTFNKKLRFDDMYAEFNGQQRGNSNNDEESSFSEGETATRATTKGKGGKGKKRGGEKRTREPREEKREEAAAEERKEEEGDEEDENENETQEAEEKEGEDGEEKEEEKGDGEKEKGKRGKRKTKEKDEKDSDSPVPSAQWNASEKQDFVKYLALYGKNWKAIAFHITTKNPAQVEDYYDKNKVKLNLGELLESTKEARETGEKKRRLSDKSVSYSERRGPGRPKKLKGEDKKLSSSNLTLSPSLTSRPASPPPSVPSPTGAPAPSLSPTNLPSTPTGATTPSLPASISSVTSSQPSSVKKEVEGEKKKKGRGRKPRSAPGAGDSPTLSSTKPPRALAPSTPPTTPAPPRNLSSIASLLNSPHTPSVFPSVSNSPLPSSSTPSNINNSPYTPALFNSHTPTIHIPSTIRWFRPNSKESIPGGDEKLVEPHVATSSGAPNNGNGGSAEKVKPGSAGSSLPSKPGSGSGSRKSGNGDEPIAPTHNGNELNVFAEILAMGFGNLAESNPSGEKTAHNNSNNNNNNNNNNHNGHNNGHNNNGHNNGYNNANGHGNNNNNNNGHNNNNGVFPAMASTHTTPIIPTLSLQKAGVVKQEPHRDITFHQYESPSPHTPVSAPIHPSGEAHFPSPRFPSITTPTLITPVTASSATHNSESKPHHEELRAFPHRPPSSTPALLSPTPVTTPITAPIPAIPTTIVTPIIPSRPSSASSSQPPTLHSTPLQPIPIPSPRQPTTISPVVAPLTPTPIPVTTPIHVTTPIPVIPSQTPAQTLVPTLTPFTAKPEPTEPEHSKSEPSEPSSAQGEPSSQDSQFSPDTGSGSDLTPDPNLDPSPPTPEPLEDPSPPTPEPLPEPTDEPSPPTPEPLSEPIITEPEQEQEQEPEPEPNEDLDTTMAESDAEPEPEPEQENSAEPVSNAASANHVQRTSEQTQAKEDTPEQSIQQTNIPNYAISSEEIIQTMATSPAQNTKPNHNQTEPVTNHYETEDQTMEEPNQQDVTEEDPPVESRTPTSDYVMDEVAQTSTEEAPPPPKHHNTTEQGTENSHDSEVTQ